MGLERSFWIAVSLFLFFFIVRAQDTLFACVDEALDKNVLENLVSECYSFHSWATDPTVNSGLIHNKRPTFWYDLNAHSPRNDIETAILKLRNLIPPAMLRNGSTISSIKGAEWWVQVRNKDESIGFHYDKDEGLASLHGKMKHPLVSTVTYLTNVGAPTLILEMITLDGNTEVPEIPDAGFLSFPKVNRHIMFSGALQHGVLGTAAPILSQIGDASDSPSSDSSRVTLLINWWTDPPIEPNTVVLTDELARSNRYLAKLMTFRGGKDQSNLPPVDAVASIEVTAAGALPSTSDESAQLSSSVNYVPPAMLAIPARDTGLTMRHTVTFPPGDLFVIDLPRTIEPLMVYRVLWDYEQVYGSVGVLDLFNTVQVSQLFSLPEPKFILVYDSSHTGLHESLLEEALPLAKSLLGRIKVYMCPTSSCGDVLNAFGLTKSDLPCAVIDDTVTKQKYVQPKRDFGIDRKGWEKFIRHSVLAK